nr:phosphatidylinositol 4-phosphate 5-kinase 9-like [Tanacetum cinerariifolium]
MGNMDRTKVRIHRRLHFKGSSLGRSADMVETDENMVFVAEEVTHAKMARDLNMQVEGYWMMYSTNVTALLLIGNRSNLFRDNSLT